MAIERTFSILKPDALQSGVIGKVLAKFEEAGLKPVAMKMVQLTKAQAEEFYGIHKERGFFKDLISFMTSGPVIVQVLEGENAVAKNREVMGATNPKNADEGTIRRSFAKSIDANTVHGSDSAENAKIEIAYFFAGSELVKYDWSK
jgi:nucleoside-diphosphate kinase